MSADKEKEKIIQYIKNYYSEFGKTPSMKDLISKCDVNSRVFYQLFRSQKEAFNLAGVPYSDEARRKVERANVARKVGKNAIIQRGPLLHLKVVTRDNASKKDDEKYVDKINLMMEKLSDVYWNHRRANPGDKDFIKVAYDELSSFILRWGAYLAMEDQEYELAKSLRYSTDPARFFFVGRGFDFNDLEGSYYEICEEKFNDMTRDGELIWDVKAREYFKVMLDEVFGSRAHTPING